MSLNLTGRVAMAMRNRFRSLSFIHLRKQHVKMRHLPAGRVILKNDIVIDVTYRFCRNNMATTLTKDAPPINEDVVSGHSDLGFGPFLSLNLRIIQLFMFRL